MDYDEARIKFMDFYEYIERVFQVSFPHAWHIFVSIFFLRT